MKFTKYILALAAVMAVSLSIAQAEVGYSVFANSGTAENLGTNNLIVPDQTSIQNPQGVPGQPVLSFLSCTAFAGTGGGSVVTTYYSTNKTVIVNTNTPGLTRTNIVNSTNGFTPNDIVLVQHLGNTLLRSQSEVLYVSTTQNTNQLVFTTAPAQTIAVGDIVYKETAGASINLSCLTATTTTIGNGAASGIAAGQRGIPWLLRVSSPGVGTNTIDAASVFWTP